MKLSRFKIFAFFASLMLLLWALYPRGLFLGYIYEGLADLTRSEQFYLDYLKQNPTNKNAIYRLTSLYERMGRPQEAIPWLRHLSDHRPGDVDVAMRYLDLLENLNDEPALYDARLHVAHTLMQQNPPPKAVIADLLDGAYQYAAWKQDSDAMYQILPDLVRYAKNSKDYDWVIGHLDFNLKKTKEVIARLETTLTQKPLNHDAASTLFSIWMSQHNYQKSGDLIARVLSEEPNNLEFLKARLSLDDATHNWRKLIADAQDLHSRQILSQQDDLDIRLLIASTYQRLHETDRALALYKQLIALDPGNQTNWLSVIYIYSDSKNTEALIPFLKDYLAHFPGDVERQKLLADTYLYEEKDLSQLPLYRAEVRRTHSVQFASDVGYSLMEAHRTDEALSWFQEMQSIFPNSKAIQDPIAQIKAEKMYTYIEARAKTEKNRRKLIPDYEKAAAAFPDNKEYRDTLRDLHHDYDNRATPFFRYTRFGSEWFINAGARAKAYWKDDWEFNAEASTGYFHSNAVNYTGYTGLGRVVATSHHFLPWEISFGLEGASSDVRATAAPIVGLTYRRSKQDYATLSGIYRQLRQDFPQAVAFGTFEDTAKFEGQTVLWDRVVVGGYVQYEHDYLPSGAEAYGPTIDPLMSVILFKKPYVTLGYQLQYVALNSNNNFMNLVPLIANMNANYLTGLVSGRPVEDLQLEGGFYWGEDFARNLEFVHADLWGFRGSFEWNINRWLDMLGSYEFGRQRLLDIPGYSQIVNVALSAHW